MKLLVALFAITFSLAACGGEEFPTEADRPPDLIVTSGEEDVTLRAYGYCWSRRSGAETLHVCADGRAPDPLPSLTVESGAELSARLPLPWLVEANILLGEEYCTGATRIEFDVAGGSIDVPVPAGTYQIDLFGRGAEGDASWAFELTTTEDGSKPLPTVQLFWQPAAVELDPGSPLSVLIGNIPIEPSATSAAMTVVAGDGTRDVYQLNPLQDGRCWEGVAAFDADPVVSSNVLDLGPPPYEITVTAIIDDTVVTSDVVTWPDDFSDSSNESARIGAAFGP